MTEDQKNFFHASVDNYLDRHVEQRAKQWSAQFGKNPDGSPNNDLACRIDMEIHRRGAIGKQLDIYEPLRWTGISYLLSAALGVGIKLTTDKSFAKPALITLLTTTALTSGIQLFRLLPRYDAGLRGGVDTAVAMHRYHEAYPDVNPKGSEAPPVESWASRVEQSRAFTPPPVPGL